MKNNIKFLSCVLLILLLMGIAGEMDYQHEVLMVEGVQ